MTCEHFIQNRSINGELTKALNCCFWCISFFWWLNFFTFIFIDSQKHGWCFVWIAKKLIKLCPTHYLPIIIKCFWIWYPKTIIGADYFHWCDFLKWIFMFPLEEYQKKKKKMCVRLCCVEILRLEIVFCFLFDGENKRKCQLVNLHLLGSIISAKQYQNWDDGIYVIDKFNEEFIFFYGFWT